MFVVVGTTTVDLFIGGLDRIPTLRGDEFTTDSLALLPEPFTIVLGGNGANAAYVLATLGAACALCSPLGQDTLGNLVVDWLASRKVDLTGLRRDPSHATASTAVVLDRSMQRLSFHHPGGSSAFVPAAVPAELIRGATTVLLTSYHLLPEFRGESGAALLAQARQAGARSALDLGPAVGRIAGCAELGLLLPSVDYCLANSYELAACTGESDMEAGCVALLQLGAGAVVVKRGHEGASLYTKEERISAPGFPVEARFTVGAGDSFNAGFLYGVEQGWPAVRSLRFANAVAAQVVAAENGVLGCPDLATVEAFLEQSV